MTHDTRPRNSHCTSERRNTTCLLACLFACLFACLLACLRTHLRTRLFFYSYDQVGLEKFSFRMFDLNDSGYLDKDELTLLLDEIYGDDVAGRQESKVMWGNLVEALKAGDSARAGEMNADEFVAFLQTYPALLAPAREIQTILRKKVSSGALPVTC